jgi:peptidoglycan/xylan/chitin deacetylase (PgdA/CDA1 family)
LDQIGKTRSKPRLVVDLDFTKAGKHLLLTFDDGGKSWLHITDELNKRGWKGHFFITTSLIGSRTFLNKEEIRYVHSCGHLIGSHSHEHPDIFKDQTLSKMVSEWRVSCDIIADIIGERCHVASLPGGDLSVEVLDSVNLAGVRYLFTSEPWLRPKRAQHAWVLGRVCPKASTPRERVRELADGRGWSREMAIRRLKVWTRNSFAPLYRMYVRHNTREWTPAEHSE